MPASPPDNTSTSLTTKSYTLNVVESGGRDGAEETFVTQRAGKIVQNDVQQQQTAITSNNKNNENRTLQSTLLLQKKKEMTAVQQQLEKKRMEFSKRMEECREKQKELKSKQRQIRERVLKFEKFLRENDAKRQRANLKAQTEKKLREQKELELGQLHLQIQQENIKSHRITELIKKYQAYERYLQSVVDILPPDYLDVNEPHINDIIMRHKTLIETNEDLMRTVVKCQDEIDRRQKGLQELVKEKNDNILVYNSTMGTQQKKFDKLKQECAYLEQKQEEHDRTGRERMRILGESKLAINNLFDRVNVARGKSITSAVNNNNNNNNVSNNNNNNSNNDQYVNSHSNAVAIALLSGGTAGGVITNTSTTQKPPQQQTAAGTDAPLGNSNAVAAQHDSVADSMTLTEKLNAIAQRIIDLQHISQKAEHFMQLAEKNAKLKAAAAAAAVAASVQAAAVASVAATQASNQQQQGLGVIINNDMLGGAANAAE